MPAPDVQKIGKYEILAELGQGGYGRVYRAFDPTVGRPVAIKILTAETSRDLLTRFRNEATAAGNLRHRNIVTVYDYGEYNGRPYLVMELLEGEDLTHAIANRTPLSLLQKMNIMDQIAAGLDCAHQNGVLHRDVKPANIRILPDGTVKIMDFGIARVNSDRNATRLTQQGDLIGTILYMSPEQFAGGEADVLCDIFAYGLIYFELLTGKHPFRSPDPRAVMFKITMQDPEPLRALAPDCPEGLERILNRALQKDRELRYQSLRDLQLDAEPLMFELRQARAASLASEATELFGGRQTQQALRLVNEALNLDPSNREARQLRENVQSEIQRETIQPRIEMLLESAQKQLAERSFTQAIQTLESASKLDGSSERVRVGLEGAREQMKRAKEAAPLAVAALGHLSRHEWLAASSKSREAARMDPLNPAVIRVREETGKYVREVLSRIDSEIQENHSLESTIRELNDLSVLEPDSLEILALLATAQARQEREVQIRQTLLLVSRLRGENRREEATQAIEAALAPYPSETRLLDLRSQLREEFRQYEAAVAGELAAGQRLLEQEVPAQAVEELRNAAARFPREEGLKRLLAEAQEALDAQRHREAVDHAAEAARRHAENRDFPGAIQVLEDALKSWPHETGLTDLLQAALTAKEQWQAEQKLKALEQRCDLLTGEKRFEEALEEIRQGLNEFPGTLPGTPGLVKRRDRLQELLERRRRADAVSKALNEAGELLEQNQPQHAIGILSPATRLYPGEGELQNLLHRAEAALLSQQREDAIETTLADVRVKTGNQDFTGAIRVLEIALQQWPEDRALTEALRNAQIGKLAQESRELARAHYYAEAVALLRAGLAEYPDEPLLAELYTELQALWEDELEQARQREAVGKAAADARLLKDRGDFAGAIAILEDAVRSWPLEAPLAELLRETRLAQALAERKRAVDQVMRQVQNLTSQNRRAEALQAVQAGLREYSGEPELLALERVLRDQLEAERRSAALDGIMKASRQLLEGGKQAKAVEVLANGCREYPGEAPLKQLLAQAEESLRLQQRQEAIESAALEAERRAERQDFAGAIETLKHALKPWPNENRLLDLLRDTVQAREQRDRAEAIRAVAARAQELLKRNRPGDALKIVNAGLQKHGPDPSLTALQTQIGDSLATQPPRTAARWQGPPARRHLLMGGLAAGAVAAAVILFVRGGGGIQPGPHVSALAIDSNVAGASITVGGQSCVLPACVLRLPAGNYNLVAARDGFGALERPLSIPANAESVKVPLVFTPLPQSVQVNTNFATGRVLLDGKPSGDLRDGQLSLDGVSAGSHTIRVTGGDAEFEARWREEPGSAPELTEPIIAKNVQATLLGNVGENGTLACNCDTRTIQVDGSPVNSAAPSGGAALALRNLKEGARRITASDRSLLVDVRPNPTLSVFLSLDRNVGTLVVESGRDNATVFLNNRPYRLLTGHGLLRIPVDVGEYSVRVEKPGFHPATAAKVQIGKGEEKQVSLTLTPLPASLEISGALPGALIKLDGKPLGEISAAGTLHSDVTEGDHQIELTKDDYTALRFGAHFTAGQATRPKPEQIAMARVAQPVQPQPIQPPVRPDSKQLEAQDWDKIRNRNSIDELDDFVRRHPGGAYTDTARARIAQLRQQAQAEAARQVEQTAWDSLDKSRKAAVQDFLSRFGSGLHQQEARTLIVELDKRDAQAIVAAEQKAKEQEQATRIPADQQSITRTLSQYETAYNAKDLRGLQTIWRAMPKPVSDELAAQFRYARGMAFQMKPAATPVVNGDSAQVTCTRSLNLTTPDNKRVNSGNEQVQVTLERAAQGWVIKSIVKI
jgi:serine/threonine protein kinase